MDKNALITTMLDKFSANLVEMIAGIMLQKDFTPENILYTKEAKGGEGDTWSQNKNKGDNMDLEQSTITRSAIIANKQGMLVQYT